MRLRFLDKLPPKRRKLLLWVVGIVFVYTILGFLILPPIVKAVARKQLSKQLGREVVIDGLRLNPYALSITIHELNIKEPNGDPFVAWERLYVNASFLHSSFFKHTVAFDEIVLTKFFAHLQVNRDGTYNFSDILKKLAESSPAEKPKQPEKPSAPLTIRISKLQIAAGSVSVNDLSRAEPFATVIGPIDVGLEHFSTNPDNKNPYAFTASTEAGEKFAYSGYFYLDPIRSGGDFSLRNISLRKYAPFYEDRVRLSMKDGAVDVISTYRVELSPTNTVTYLTNALVTVRSLKIAERGADENAIEIGNVTVSNAYIDAVAQLADIGSITTTGGKFILRRGKDNAINILTMVTPPPGPTNAPKPVTTAAVSTNAAPAVATNKPAFLANIHRFGITDYAIRFEDFSNPRPVRVDFDQIAVTLTNISTAPGTVIGITTFHRWNGTGTVKVNGTFGLSPVTASADLDLQDIPVPPADPYLEPVFSLHLTDGALYMKGHVNIDLPEVGDPSVKFKGDFGVKNFASVDGAQGDDFLKWSVLRLSKIDLTSAPMSVSVGEILLADESLHLVIWSNKVMNVNAILRKEPASPQTSTNAPVAEAKPATTNAAPLPPITVGVVVLTNNTFSFTDKSVKPTVSMSIDHFSGTVTGLKSDAIGSAKVDLAGRVDGTAPFEIKGQVNPLTKAMTTDLKVNFENIDLTPLSPYTGKYVGNTLAKGKLSLDLKYLIDKRNLDAQNVINLDQFTLGQKVNSPDATKLPVGLAIALLKDVNGRIHIDVPVQGNLDDPKFRLGKLIWQTLGNLIVKAATSPFNLIGSMFGGGGGEELSYQEFAAGSSQLQTNEIKKLDVLVKALSARPALNLEIQGSIDEERDREALRHQRLEARLRMDKFQEMRKAGQTAPAPDQIVLTKDDYVRYLKAEYLNASLQRIIKETVKPAGSPTSNTPNISTNTVEGVRQTPIDSSTKPWNDLGKKTLTPKGTVTGKTLSTASAPTAKLSPEQEVAAMERPLLDQIAISPDDFRALAYARAKVVEDYILQTDKVKAERLSLLESAAEPPPSKGTRAVFNLK